jgi:hypothetical protein
MNNQVSDTGVSERCRCKWAIQVQVSDTGVGEQYRCRLASSICIAIAFRNHICFIQIFLYLVVRSLDLTAHTSLSPIRHRFVPSFVNYKKGCTRLAATSDKVYQLLAQGRWFSPGTPASSTDMWGTNASRYVRDKCFKICEGQMLQDMWGTNAPRYVRDKCSKICEGQMLQDMWGTKIKWT